MERLREYRAIGRPAPPEYEPGDAWEGPRPPIPLPPSTAGREPAPLLKARLSRRAAQVPKKQPRWRWRDWMPEGELCLLDGDPGLGKSTLFVDVAARITRGWHMPPGPREPEPGRLAASVVMIVGEDSLEYTVVHRLEAAGADLDRVVFHEGYRDEGGERDFDLGLDLADLAAMIEAERAAAVMIDPIMAFLGTSVDAHKDQDVRRLLRPLSRAAQATRATVLLIRHLNKLSGGAALYRGGGSIGIIGAARAAWIAGTDPDDATQERHVLAMNKCNLGPRPLSLAYRLEPVGGTIRIAWEEAPIDLRANDVLGGAQHGPGRPNAELRDAEAWLKALLGHGAVSAADVRTEADGAGYAWRTINRAKALLKLECWRVSNKWMWALPTTSAPASATTEAPLPD